jgi:predicted metalloprotease
MKSVLAFFLLLASMLCANAQQANSKRSEVTSSAPPVSTGTPNDPTGKFIAFVLGSTEDVWEGIFAASGRTYHPPKLRLFSGAEQGGCGLARASIGPFYCATDQRIYLDTAFFEDLRRKFGGCDNDNACKFSEAYVIAQMVGYHVQNELGILPRVLQEQQASASKAERNALQVRLTLQADCLAGIWANRANHKRNFLASADVDKAIEAEATIANGRQHKESQRDVEPDASIHGTSEQRKRWFLRGMKEGDVNACNTFAANVL